MSLMSATETPSAPAFAWSMSSWYSGTSSWPLGRTPTRRLSCAAMPRNWLRAAISASWPRPARSCSCTLKPLEVPSSSTAGGTKANTIASLICENAPMARPAIDFTSCPGAWRSSQGSRLTKPMPMFWPWPAKLKPATVKIERTLPFSFSRYWCSTFFSTSTVRSWVAPAGRMTWVNITPWSSSGRKDGRHAQEQQHQHADDGDIDHQEAQAAPRGSCRPPTRSAGCCGRTCG